MKQILLYVWQLPQNLIGLLVILFSKAKYNNNLEIHQTECRFGVSLGKYIILWKPRYFTPSTYMNDVKHEQGHQKQSLYLGWLYLIVIGLPSACGNLFDRIFHRKWENADRERWYYKQPWEAWADKLGGVER